MHCELCEKTFGPGEERVLMPCSHGKALHTCAEEPRYRCLDCYLDRAGPAALARLVTAW